MDRVTVTILSWDKINGRKDIFNPSWFKFKHNFFEDPDFYDFTHEEVLVWIYLLCLASKTSSNRVTIHFLHAERIGRLSRAAVESALEKLKKLDCIGSKDDGAMAVLDEGKKRERARREVKKAIRRGILIRPSICQDCKSENVRIAAHHPDYDQPLDVEWLCHECHGLKHKGIQRLTSYAFARRSASVRRPNVYVRDPAAREEKRREEQIREQKNTHAQPAVAGRATVFDFESLYRKYPRKEGKCRGMKTCAAQIKTEEDYAKLSLAIDRYVEHCKKTASDPKYVKHFSTFMNSWRDWLDPDAGTSEIGKSDPYAQLEWA